jgi:hypothetical protein
MEIYQKIRGGFGESGNGAQLRMIQRDASLRSSHNPRTERGELGYCSNTGENQKATAKNSSKHETHPVM